jgi:PDZ domain-containing protein
MKFLIHSLLGLLFCFLYCPSATAQYGFSNDAAERMAELKMSIAPFYEGFLIDDFDFDEDVGSNSNYQVTALHADFPIRFTLNLMPNSYVDVIDRMNELSESVGLINGQVYPFTEKNKVAYYVTNGAMKSGYLENDVYEACYVVVMKSETGYIELVIYYDRTGNTENPKFKTVLDNVLNAFKFNVPKASGENFAGIGIAFGIRRSNFEITGVVKDGVADKGGLLPGDIIVWADEHDASKKDMSRMVNILRGEENSTLNLQVKRGSLYYDFDLVRKPYDKNAYIEMITADDINLKKLYFLNFNHFMLKYELNDKDVGEYIESDDIGTTYRYSINFPVNTAGFITQYNNGKSEIEYVIVASKERENIVRVFNELVGYLEEEYSMDFLYATKVEEDKIKIITFYLEADESTPEIIHAEMFIDKNDEWYRLNYVYNK